MMVAWWAERSVSITLGPAVAWGILLVLILLGVGLFVWAFRS